MSGHNNIYKLHAAALSRHAFEKKQPQEPNKKKCSTLTATLKEAFSPAPELFSYNTTPHLQPPKGSQGAPGVDIEGGSARVNSSNKFSTIIPDYAYLEQPTIEPKAYEVHQRHEVTKRRKRLGCFSCTRRLSTSSDGSVYSRPANPAVSIMYDNTQSPKPIVQTYGHDTRRTITPTMSSKAALAKPALVQHSSLKHTKSQPGWVLMPKIPRNSIGQRPLLQAKDVEDNADTDAYSLELQSSRVPTGQARANSRTILCEQEKFLNLEKVSVREAVSPPTTKRSGRTGIPLSELGGPHPRGRDNLIAQQCNLAENAPLQTANRADSNQHPLQLDPENSVYQNDPTFCWGCEDDKSRCDKKTGLCKKCELYLVPCLEWTPDKMVQTPRTTIHHSQEILPVHNTCGQRSDSPTLGRSATHIRISQPGAKGKERVALHPVYPPIVPKPPVTTANSGCEDHIPPKSHFSNTTIATFSCPSSLTSEGDLAPFHYDNSPVPGKEIQALCNYWNGGVESSATSGSSNGTIDKPREEVWLHPAPKAKGYMKCFNGLPSPMRLAGFSSSSRPESLTLPSLNLRQRSQKGAISGIYQHAENQEAIGSWIDFSGHDSGLEEEHQDTVTRSLLEEGPLTGTRLSRAASSIYSLYLDSL